MAAVDALVDDLREAGFKRPGDVVEAVRAYIGDVDLPHFNDDFMAVDASALAQGLSRSSAGLLEDIHRGGPAVFFINEDIMGEEARGVIIVTGRERSLSVPLKIHGTRAAMVRAFQLVMHGAREER